MEKEKEVGKKKTPEKQAEFEAWKEHQLDIIKDGVARLDALIEFKKTIKKLHEAAEEFESQQDYEKAMFEEAQLDDR